MSCQLSVFLAGIDAVARAPIWDVQSRFRIIIGAVDDADFLSLSPEGERMRRVVKATRFDAGPHQRFDVQVIFTKQAVPESRLDGATRVLGWNAWLKRLPSARDAGEPIHSVDG